MTTKTYSELLDELDDYTSRTEDATNSYEEYLTSISGAVAEATDKAQEATTQAEESANNALASEASATASANSAAEAAGYVGGVSDLTQIARSLNVVDSAVIYATDTTTELDGVSYIYDASTQTTYGVPTLNSAGETIVSVSGSNLVTSGGSYTLIKHNTNILADDFGAVGNGVVDDTIALQLGLSSLKPMQFLELTPGKTYKVDNLLLNGIGSGRGIVCNDGYAKLLFDGDGIGLDIQGSTSTVTSSNWYWQLKNLKFGSTTASTIHTHLRIGGGDTWYGRVDKCIFEGYLGKTVQNACLTNDNESAFRDYYTLFDNCVFRNAEYHIVGGGDWSTGELVQCKQAVNRVRLIACDFYEHTKYGLAIYKAESGDASNGWMVKQLHTDHSANALGDIWLSGNNHSIDGFFESGSGCVLDLDAATVDPWCNIQALSYPVTVKVQGESVEDGSFPTQSGINGPQGHIFTSDGGNTTTTRHLRSDGIDAGNGTDLLFTSGHENDLAKFYFKDYTESTPESTLYYGLYKYGFIPNEDLSKHLGLDTKRWSRAYVNSVYCTKIISKDTSPVNLYSGHGNNWTNISYSDDGGVTGTTHYSFGLYDFTSRSTSKNLGNATYKWDTLYATNSTIETSDEREKELSDITAVEKECAAEIKTVIKKFKWLDSIESKGDDARIHFGVGAQTVKSIFESHNLNPDDYGLFCYDEWNDEFGDDGELITNAGNRYGIRYTELIMFILSAV